MATEKGLSEYLKDSKDKINELINDAEGHYQDAWMVHYDLTHMHEKNSEGIDEQIKTMESFTIIHNALKDAIDAIEKAEQEWKKLGWPMWI